MKRLLKTASLLSLIAIPFGAHAEGPTDAANFTPRLKLQSRYSLSDSYRKNQMDLISTTARFGMNYRYKNVLGLIEMQAGSASDGYTSSSSSTPTDNGRQSLFVVRRAHIGLELYKTDPATVTFVLGRDHLSGSVTYAPDAITQILSTNLDNVSATTGEDGLSLKYAGKYEFGKVSAVLGYYNNMAVSKNGTGSGWFTASSVVYADNAFNAEPKSQSRAMLGIVTADISAGEGVVEVKALYNSQPNAVTKATSTSYTSRDVSNAEVSVGYNFKDKSLKGGVWYQSVTLGDTQTSSGTFTTNDINYTNSNSNDSQTINTFGVGVVGNSKLWGMTGLLADDDMLTYGVGYQNADGQLLSGVAGFSKEKLTTDFYNVGIGYQQGNFNLEFDYANANANYAIYTNSSGDINEKSANIFYLVGTLAVS
jgi:hypothetical protein